MRYRAEDFQKDFWVNIGKRIRLRREQFGLTRDQLSYEIGVSEKTLGQIERGEHGCSVARLFIHDCLQAEHFRRQTAKRYTSGNIAACIFVS